MSHSGRLITMFLVGLGIGGAVAVLLAPQSGEDTRDWLANAAERKAKMLRRKGQESIEHLQDAVDTTGEKISKILKSSKEGLDAVSAKLG